MQAISRLPQTRTDFDDEVIVRFSRIAKSRASKNFAFDYLQTDDASIETATGILSSDCWLDEQAAFLGLLKQTETSSSRVAKRILLKSTLGNGLLSDMVDQSFSN